MRKGTVCILITSVIIMGYYSSTLHAQLFFTKNDFNQIKLYTDSLAAVNKPQAAIDYLKELVASTQMKENIDLKAELFHEIQTLFLHPELSFSDSTIYYLKKEIDLISDDTLLYHRYMELGNWLGQSGLFYEAEAPYLEALKRIRFAPTRKAETQTYIYVGLVYAKLGQLEKGISYIDQAIAVASATNDKQLEYQSLYGKAFYHSITREYEKDLILFPRLLALGYELGDSARIYQTLRLGSSVYDALEKRDTAELYISMARNYISDQNPFAHCDILLTLASIQLHNKNIIEARKNVSEALVLLKKYNWEGTENGGYAHEILADIAVLSDNDPAAIEHFKVALHNAKKGGRKHKEKEILLGFIAAYKRQEDYKMVITYMDEYITLSDTLSKDLYKEKLAEAEAKIGLRIKEQELKNKNLQLFAEKKQRQLFTGLAVLLGLGLLLFGYFFYKNTKAKKYISTQKKLLEISLNEKEILLQEVSHRVKNNLQIISSLLDKQARNSPDENFRKIIYEAKNRIQTMALIHQRLYQTSELSTIPIKKYIQELAQNIDETQKTSNKDISISLNVGDFNQNIDTAILVGLILNELFTNAFKYAFTNRTKGQIQLDFHQKNNNEFTLLFQDNGIGLKDGFELGQKGALGLSLVEGLVEQLEGVLEVSSSKKGTVFLMKFKSSNAIFSKNPLTPV